MNAPPPPPVQERPHARSPLAFTLGLGIKLLFTTITAWAIGTAIGIVGCYTYWEGRCERRAWDLVREDMDYITAAPRSVVVGDTVDFSERILDYARWPYDWLGVTREGGEASGPQRLLNQQLQRADQDTDKNRAARGLAKSMRATGSLLKGWALISMYALQDVLLRLSVAIFALPAFALACLLGVLDGMVRRDLRRWSGGRESSFIYHYAKRWVGWALVGGFALYLGWPFGGFNPAYMVLVFTALVAATLSTTVAAFKKYL